MKRIFLALLVLAATAAMVTAALHKRSVEPSPLAQLVERYSKKVKPSVDHSLFTQLKKPFATPQEVTAACIECHNGRAAEVMQSSHWNWERTEYIPGKGIRAIGKRNILNNFCIGVAGNQQSCDRCHIGYGWTNSSFDFKNPQNVDCLACHDNSGTYNKKSEGAGLPDPTVNLTNVAQHVGKPQRMNCGTCHFFGGGGNNVKHGDLEQALFDTTRDVDVHMASDGRDMQCVDCHTATKHQMLGKMYSVSSMNRNRVECETCHTRLPHADSILNDHTLKVACQTCHIPTYAKVNPTKLAWDWSTAGRLKDGKPYEVKEKDGTDSYMSIKGSFTWASKVKPDYVWFNGTASHYLIGDQFDPSKPLLVNQLHGGYDDPDAKIYPVKIHRANQIYDAVNHYLIQPKLYSAHAGDGGFWGDFDWERAAEEGMKQIDLPYSGHYGFARTEMYWPVNHMVSPKEAALTCGQCHTRDHGRLEHLPGFYMPGRDRSAWLDWCGGALLALTFAGVVVHGGARAVASRRRKEQQ